MLEVIPFVYTNDPDDLCSNTYIVIDEDNNCVVIDPSSTKDGVKNYIVREKLNLKAILLTHGHVDHFKGAKNLIDEFNSPVYIASEDAEFLTSPYCNCSMFMGEDITLDVTPEILFEGDKLSFLNDELEVIYTPYHTSGSVCFYSKVNNGLFTGDSLFKGCVGRSDLPGSKPRQITKSLGKLFVLPEETKVYPGHGPFTTIKNEKNNRYF